MIECDFSIESKFFRNIMDWDAKVGWVVKPEVQKWIDENINRARLKWSHRSVGTYDITHLIFDFNNMEDAMAFKLRWI